jgi:hypothetical protein
MLAALDVQRPAAIDRRVTLPEPPERLAEPVECLRIVRIVGEGGNEGISRGRPIGVRKALPPLAFAVHVEAF